MESTLIPDLVAVLFTAGIAAWICQKIKISPIIGYLVTGIIVGPFTYPHAVHNFESIHTLANLGLIFVMFFIGLELSLKRLKSLGLAPALVSFLTALLIFNAIRLGGGFFGFDGVQSLFVAGTIMISSSVIVNRVTNEMGLGRAPFARSAVGVTLLEDAVAVCMLAILGSVGVSDDSGQATGNPNVLSLIGHLAAFVLLALIVALAFVPKLLDRVCRISSETASVIMAGLLFCIAYIASSAGYSLALGAFLLGSVVGGTNHKERFLHAFEGMHDVFAAVFFVSMGMLFDVNLFWESLPLALGLTACAVIGRTFAAFVAFLVAGKPLAFSTKAAFCLVPLGEFSFVIAQLGVHSGRMEETFFPACVGAVLITTILAPWVTKMGIRLGDRVGKHEPKFISAWRGLLGKIANGSSEGSTGILAKFKERGIQSKAIRFGVLVAVVLSVLGFSSAIADALRPIFDAPSLSAAHWLKGHFDVDISAPKLFGITYWSALTLILFAPCIAIWNDLRSIASNVAFVVVVQEEMSQPLTTAQRILSQAIEAVVLIGGATLFILLIGIALPSAIPFQGKSLVFFVLIVLVALLIRARLTQWQVKVQEEILAEVHGRPEGGVSPSSVGGISDILEAAEAVLASEMWQLSVREIRVEAGNRPVGMTLASTGLRSRFGCTVAAIDRNGVVVSNPAASAQVFPDDKLLLVGTTDQLANAEAWIREKQESAQIAEQSLPFSELVTESITAPETFSGSGSTLAQLGIAGRFRVMVLGIERNGQLFQNPAGDQVILAGDRMLILGFPAQNRAFLRWMESASIVPTKVEEVLSSPS